MAGAISNARAASNTLAKLASVEESQLVFMGRSLGGAILVQIAGDVQPRGLVIESSFSSVKRLRHITTRSFHGWSLNES